MERSGGTERRVRTLLQTHGKLKLEAGNLNGSCVLTEVRGKGESANSDNLSKNVTNLQPERFSRRAILKRR